MAMSQAADHYEADWHNMAGLYRRFRNPLNSYFRRRTIAASEAEDLTQEVFLRLARHQETLTFQAIEALIFTIAANLLRDRGRRQATRGLPPLSVEQDLGATAEPNLIEVIEPERVLIGRNTLDLALAALGELGERTRDVFMLQRVEGWKNREIAQELGISVSAVEKHMVKALTHIGQRLGQ